MTAIVAPYRGRDPARHRQRVEVRMESETSGDGKGRFSLYYYPVENDSPQGTDWTRKFFFGTSVTGGAWLSSARVVRCWVKSRNERNPYLQ